jgi:formylglycine-generating enzyme required for sulfatase activity
MFETACRQELWQAVMGDNPSRVTGPMLPVTHVSWEDARRFVERLNELRPGLAVDLPSEAQWEYACRAGTDTAYSFGPEIGRDQVNYESGGTVPVGSLPPNRWGLHEMHGNVWEWCADTWHDNYIGAPADGSVWVDGAAAGRVVRGGSWFDVAGGVRAAYRLGGEPDYRDADLGFRCARVQRE